VNSLSSPTDWSELVRMLMNRADEQPEHVLRMLRELLLVGRDVVNCSEVGMMVPDVDGTHLHFLVSVNSDPAVEEVLRTVSVPCDRSLAGCVFNTGQMVSIANPDQFYQAVDQKTGLQTSIYMVTPVFSADEVLGVLTFVNRPARTQPEPFNEVEIEWAQRLADFAAAGIKLYKRTQLQRRQFRCELSDVAGALDVDAASISGDAQGQDDLDESPISLALGVLEKMSRREQGLAVEMLNLLNRVDD
jgi:transcriptional regulator with GAF, ATPase, and Fis domain